MIYKKLISVLVFAAFGFCFAEAARAQSCDPSAVDFDPTFCDPNNPQCSLACFIFGCPNCNMGSTTGSSVDCTLHAGGSNVLNKKAATFAEITKADCTHTDSTGTTAPVTCDFELVMSGVTLSACTPSGSNSSIRATGFCQDKGLTVAGTLTCPVGSPICAGNNPCIMNFGIDGMARNKTQCETVFPVDILPAGQVLDVTVTTKGSTCDGALFALSDIRKRWCNSGDFANSPVDCTPPAAVTRRSGEVATSAVPFNFDVQQTVNTSPTNCKGGTGIDKGFANVEIFGSRTFDVATVALSSLSCEGQQLTGCTTKDLNRDGFPDLACNVATCPTFGPTLGTLPRNPDGTVTATCTGQMNSGTKALGFGEVNISPQ